MTALERYEMTTRVERVEITYRRTTIEIGQQSKVYKVRTEHFPSGSKYVFLVWSNEAQKCIWVRSDDVKVIKVADVRLHKIR